MMQSEFNKTKVCIADKHFIHRLGVKTILSVIGIEPDLYEADSLETTLSCLSEINDVKYLIVAQDVLHPELNKSLRKIKNQNPNAKLLVVCDGPCQAVPGAKLITENDTRQEVLEKFQNFFFHSEPESTDNDSALLSERETEVLKTVALGYSNKETAEKLFISINTVISHRKNITEKLGIKTIAGLTVYAVMHDLIKPEDVKA
ncbi:MAG: response regulator transcription factor [Carboxylicivirga sp.]|jgi:DNA-binding NarL/FixJ family response regulator|nr:response regulator transcription factor [Carboxylicivirga sp.]